MGLLDRLRPHPHRGDLVAAGVVPFALGLVLVELRMTQWSDGAHLLVVGLGALLVLAMGLLSPMESEAPRAYQTVLFVAGLILLAMALFRLADVLGADHSLGAGKVFWTSALLALIAAHAARGHNSAICTLIAALATTSATLAFVQWAFEPSGTESFRWVLLALITTFALCSLRLRDVRHRHAVQLVNAAGLTAVALGITGAHIGLAPSFGDGGSALQPVIDLGGGWLFVLLAVGLGSIAYAGVDHEPGPAIIGLLVLVPFAICLAHGHSLLGWTLILLMIGGLAVAAGLRPRRELPPEPPGPTAPTVPLAPPSTGAPPPAT